MGTREDLEEAARSLLHIYQLTRIYLLIPVCFLLGIGLIVGNILGTKGRVAFNDIYPGAMAILAGFGVIGLIYWSKHRRALSPENLKFQQELYSTPGPHLISQFSFASNVLEITLYHASYPYKFITATFEEAKLNSPSWNNLDRSEPYPWSIQVIECSQVSESRWNFCLRTDQGDCSFDSSWPKIVK